MAASGAAAAASLESSADRGTTFRVVAALGLAAATAVLCRIGGARLPSRRRRKAEVSGRLLQGRAEKRTPSLAEEIAEALALERDEDDDVEETFALATSWISAGGATALSNAQKLEMYGMFKQAKEGDCPKKSKPWGLEAGMKWESWRKNAGSSCTFVMRRYAVTLDKYAPGWREEAARSSGSGARGMSTAPSVSTMGQIGDPDQAGETDETPVGKLCEAIADGEIDDVRAILSRSPDLAFTGDKDGMTPLHWAADRGSIDAVDLLLAFAGDGSAAAARLNIRDQAGDTALHYAVLTDNPDIASRLVSRGADPRIENEDGETAVTAASEIGWDVSIIFPEAA